MKAHPIIRGLMLAAVSMPFVLGATAVTAQSTSKGMKIEQAKADTMDLTCEENRAMVEQNKSVVLRSGPNHFDLYHRSDFSCGDLMQRMEPAFVRSKNNPLCFVGYTCENYSSSQ